MLCSTGETIPSSTVLEYTYYIDVFYFVMIYSIRGFMLKQTRYTEKTRIVKLREDPQLQQVFY